jgi:site-specific recombinase XerC
MAGSKRPGSTASNRDDLVDDARAKALTAYLEWLKGRPLAARSREAYAHQVRRYIAWLADRSPVDGDPLANGDARDWAVRDYKRHLKAVERWKPASVNLTLAALDSFYTQLGLGRPVVRREDLPAKAPRALTEDQVRRLLRMAERARARDRAIVVMLLYTGLRLAELVALDVDDVRISARKGVVIVRSGKGDAYREVPLNALVRQVLEEWLAERKSKASGDGERAVFVGRSGRRLSKRSVDDVVRGVGKDAAVSLVRASPAAHVPDPDGQAGLGPRAGRRAGWPSAVGDNTPLQPAVGHRPAARGREPADRLLTAHDADAVPVRR